MAKSEYKKYQKEQNRFRIMQTWYGNKLFSLPYIYKLRNRAYTKCFSAGTNLRVGYNVTCYRTHGCKDGILQIGDNVSISNNAIIEFSGKVVIEDDVSISNGCRIYSHKHQPFDIISKDRSAIPVETVIKKGAKLEAACIILPGVTVGEYATVYAGAVVIQDVEPYSIVAGNPARDIRDVFRQWR